MITHTWFQSGDYSLLAHLHSPGSAAYKLGVVIVPPLGWEDVCSYRPLRELAQTLAEKGIPVLRFDLPATGDSSGTAQDAGLLATWTRSVTDSVKELRRLTGVRNVAVAGIKLGAMLSVASAAAGADIQQLVLWGPYATGRALLRELRAFRNLEVSEFGSGQERSHPHDESVDGLESAGYLIMPETLADLEALDLSKLDLPSNTKVLMLSRDSLPCDAKLVRCFSAAGCKVDIETGQGLSAMMALPHEVISPLETYQQICKWLLTNLNAEEVSLLNVTGANQIVCGTVRESIYSEHNNFGILAQPANPAPAYADWCILFLNPGAGRHIGPNRVWVESARRMAHMGVTSLRLDLTGIGEAGGEQNLGVSGLYNERLVDHVQQTMMELNSRIGAKRFIAIGLCSGAFLAFHAAVSNPNLRSAILFNPRLFFWDPEVDRRRELRRTAEAMRNSSTWMRLLGGQVNAKRIKDAANQVIRGAKTSKAQIPSAELHRALDKVAKHGTRLTLVFTEGEPLLRELEEEGHLPQRGSVRPFHCIRIADAGHTFRPRWAQKAMHELIDKEVTSIIGILP